MNYIFINPVTDAMFDSDDLEKYLAQRDCKRVYCNEPWVDVVLNKYKYILDNTTKCVVDMRCPTAAMEAGKHKHENLFFPDIHPILIHCGIELSERQDLKDAKKIITTPCAALADYGNDLGLDNTEFVSWNKWFYNGNDIIKPKVLSKSPLPLGFFEKLKYPVKSLTGRDVITSFFEKENFGDYRLLE